MTEFKSISLATQVFEKLEEDIITGVYPKGEILTELKLVEQLGVSRTPIREALRRLEQERLIAESGKGSVVLGITLEDLVDIMDIRQRIEGLAAYHATKNLTEAGKEASSRVEQLAQMAVEQAGVGLTEERRAVFYETLELIAGNLMRISRDGLED